jgi:hypothetical protein
MTGGRVSDHFSLHPPTTSLLLVPISWLDLTTARIVWQLVNLILLIAALWLIIRALDVNEQVWRIAFVAFALVYTPLAENFRVGQTYVLVLFLFALALWGEMRAHPVWTGVGLGLAAGIKLSGAPLWLLLAVRGQWRALLWSFGVGFATVMVGLVLGWEGWLAFFGRLANASGPMPLAAHVAFQTTPSLFQRLFVPSGEFNPSPLVDAPWLSTWLYMLVTGVALGLTLWFGRRARLEIAFAAAVTLNVILFPTAIEYHYTLLLIPLAVMGSQLLSARSPSNVIWFALVLVLLCLPFDWNAPRWSEGAWMLLAYPRLYGGWLLWLWLLRQMMIPSPARVRLSSRMPSEQTA